MTHRLRSALLTVLCAALLPLAAQNRHDTTEGSMERQGMVKVKNVCPTIHVSLMYGRADNFTGKVLYTDLKEAYLHPQAAKALAKAQKILQEKHPELSLIIFDAARPMHVQKKMWEAVVHTPKYFYVSNPAHGGGLHNYGLAVDISICRAASGDTLPMGTRVDYMGRAAHIDIEPSLIKRHVMSRQAVNNRGLLRHVMRAAGFKPLRTEWWHFNYKSRAQAKRHYKVIQ